MEIVSSAAGSGSGFQHAFAKVEIESIAVELVHSAAEDDMPGIVETVIFSPKSVPWGRCTGEMPGPFI